MQDLTAEQARELSSQAPRLEPQTIIEMLAREIRQRAIGGFHSAQVEAHEALVSDPNSLHHKRVERHFRERGFEVQVVRAHMRETVFLALWRRAETSSLTGFQTEVKR